MNTKKDWTTKISNAQDIEFAALVADHELALHLYIWVWEEDNSSAYYLLSWSSFAAYKNVNELISQLKDFDETPSEQYSSRWTFYVENSSWEEEARTTPFFPANIKHYVVFTVTNTIHVLSQGEPTIERVPKDVVAAKGIQRQTAIKVYFKDSKGTKSELPPDD